MKVLAVGDVHTKTWIINEVRKIADNYDAVVFVGDYADDWGKLPRDTIQTWLELRLLQKEKPHVQLVIGNHDYIYVNKTSTISGGYSMGTQFILDVPENKKLKKWLSDLPVVIEVDGVTYSHAGLVDSFKQEYTSKWLWNDNSPLWVRPLEGNFYLEMPQVFGHTPSETCWEVQPNIWCIDTFSTYPDGRQFGDNTVLEVIDGKTFNKIKLEKQNARNNNTTSGIS